MTKDGCPVMQLDNHFIILHSGVEVLIYGVLFWIYIVVVALLVGYDLFNLKTIKKSAFVIEMFLVWTSAVAMMYLLYKLGLDGIKFFLVPDIMVVYFFGGLSLQVFGIHNIIRKSLDI